MANYTADLEAEVSERTEEVLALEKQAHEMALEMKARDIDALSASNITQAQYIQNLIADLEQMQRAGKDLSLKAVITRLKGQQATEEKLQVLQQDIDRVNSAFYSRLQQQFPALTKTERELCAFIKLNLSNKDIADLRNTTTNTINVARSRIRKKLRLDRNQELESFIQQL